jgi:molecular chaperone DnaJ
MRGKGVPQLRGRGRGDQMVVINVEIPKHLTSEQSELMEKLAASLGTEAHPQERSFLDSLRDIFGV